MVIVNYLEIVIPSFYGYRSNTIHVLQGVQLLRGRFHTDIVKRENKINAAHIKTPDK
jgi:hypothetical protein